MSSSCLYINVAKCVLKYVAPVWNSPRLLHCKKECKLCSRSSQSGPSLVPHWNPWTMESFTEANKPLSTWGTDCTGEFRYTLFSPSPFLSLSLSLSHFTSEGRVSSTRMLGPVLSGPKAQMERAARRSQSYLVWKNSPRRFLSRRGGGVCVGGEMEGGEMHSSCSKQCLVPAHLGQVTCTTSFSISSARPFSRGSAIMVSLFLQGQRSSWECRERTNPGKSTNFLFGVSAKHFSEDVSTTVSQNATTGSATLISDNRDKLYYCTYIHALHALDFIPHLFQSTSCEGHAWHSPRTALLFQTQHALHFPPPEQ